MIAALELTTHAAAETEALGRALAGLLPPGTVVALFGDLAAGKTCLVRGMAAFFAGDEPIHSPTFTLVNEYGSGHKLYHVDLYRLSGPEELADLGYEEIFDSEGVCAVEWAERADHFLPERRVEVHLEHAGRDQRSVRILNYGILPENWEAILKSR